MNLTLPVPTVTLGPEWASEIVAAFETVDSHDHSNGFGALVTPAGLDINADLDFQTTARAINQKSTRFADQAATLVGAINASSVYSKSGNLYYTNASGIAVQITNGASIVSSPAAVTTLQFDKVSSDTVIASGDATVYLSVDTTSGVVTVTLPAASAVAAGRIYVIADEFGKSETNALTVAAAGSDKIMGAATAVLSSNFATLFLISDGVSKWCVV